MKKRFPYVVFLIRVFYYIVALVITIVFYFGFREQATTVSIKILLLALPIIAIVLIICDLHLQIKQLKEFRKTQNSH